MKRSHSRRYVLVIALTLAQLLLCFFSTPAPTHAQSATAPPEGFASAQIRAIWERDDGSVASGKVSRAWMWGPGPFHADYEPYSGTPGASHLVQYFDKGRMEINDPSADKQSQWYVTSGRLVYEMVAGQAQTGEGRVYSPGPARIPVAGDDGNTQAPTYASFAALTGKTTGALGMQVATMLDASGKTSPAKSPPATVTLTRYEGATGHNWADVFWRFANAADRPARFDWLYTLGYPITEPYWIQAPVNGKPTMLLVQLFERRSLTFNPANPAGTQVEMGNVGRHYYRWRYADLHTAPVAAHYNVQIAVGPRPTRATSVQEQVDFTNVTGQPLTTVVLHAPWNHWDGVFSLKSAKVGEQAAHTAWRQGINLEVQLPSAIPAGGAVSVQLAFDLKPRPVGGRTGYDRDNDILCLGDMLPTVVPWQNGGWAIYPYSDLGDLGYYLSSEYRVQIAPQGSEKLVVGGTGDLAAYDAQRSIWTFTASNVRDVAYIVSPRLVDPRSDAQLTRKVGNITVYAYFTPEHRAQAKRQLDLVAPVLQWMGSAIGPYPFDTYTIGEMGVPLEPTDNYAQEYPMAYFIPTSWLGYSTNAPGWPWYTPMHETIHQWFYSTVGNNQLTDPWLDEAMTTYATTEYIRANFADEYSPAYASMTASASLVRPASSGVYSGFTNERQYTATVYDTAVQMLTKVRHAMGDNAFYDALRDYYRTYRFKQATPANLLTTLQSHTPTDLKPIFSAYLTY